MRFADDVFTLCNIFPDAARNINVIGITLKNCCAHLLAINEPSEFCGRVGLATGAIQREHVSARVHLFLAGYRWLFLR